MVYNHAFFDSYPDKGTDHFLASAIQNLRSKEPKAQKNMIDSFVNAIVLYDDKIIFYFNYKENAETLYQKDLEDFSDLFVSAPPIKVGVSNGYPYLYCIGNVIGDSKATMPSFAR